MMMPAFQRMPLTALRGELASLPADFRCLIVDEAMLEPTDVTTVTAPAPTRKSIEEATAHASLVIYAIDPQTTSFTVGRKIGADVVIADRRISSKHARFDWTSDAIYWLSDLKSSNGTFVDGRDVRDSRVLITPGTTFVLGRLPIQLLDLPRLKLLSEKSL